MEYDHHTNITNSILYSLYLRDYIARAKDNSSRMKWTTLNIASGKKKNTINQPVVANNNNNNNNFICRMCVYGAVYKTRYYQVLYERFYLRFGKAIRSRRRRLREYNHIHVLEEDERMVVWKRASGMSEREWAAS